MVEELEQVFEKDSNLGTSIVTEMLRLFRGDTRRVMQQRSSGDYGVLHSGSLTSEDLRRHILGNVSVSIYLLDENSQCSTICFDVDIPKIKIPENNDERQEKKKSEFLPVIIRIVDHIKSIYNVSDDVFLLEDTGGRGYHLWFFFEQPQSAESVIIFEQEVKQSVGIDSIEIFPPTPKNGPSGFSKSNVRLPLGVHRKYPGSRSVFLDLGLYEPIPPNKIGNYLQNIKFLSPGIPIAARNIVEKQTETLLKQAEIRTPMGFEIQSTPETFLGSIGEMISLCPALSDLVSKARKDGHLKHHERIALALILQHCDDGIKHLNNILENCSDYSVAETQKHIKSLAGYRPISCARLQSLEYNICGGWCRPQLAETFTKGYSPTPLWFARLWKDRSDIKTGENDPSLLIRIASIDNLHHAWQQAQVQAKERDIFENVLAYESFAEHLMPNLHILQAEILTGRYRHRSFRSVQIPKKKEDYQETRPVCWASPWDSIVTIAVLNVIGPSIDSTFHKNSMGNRLARGPKADGQVFEDWRKQNLYRQIRREGFSEYGERYYYVLTDITRFYEFVQHDTLMSFLRGRINDQPVLDIIQQFLEAEWLHNGSPIPRHKPKGIQTGLPQGPALSAFLANLYLNELDNWLEQKAVDFVRYVDDLAILCESEEAAKGILSDLQEYVKQQLGLDVSDDPQKTRGPFPASDTTEICDWIREARYELVKYARRAESLTPAEKNEMRSALEQISGATFRKPADLGRLVKYLGFYIANTEKLGQPDLQKGVYSLALYVLNEERPKQNATSIAIKALIKACEDFGEDAWIELKKLIESREDEYLRLVMAQEARRYLEEDPERHLYPELQKTIEKQIGSSEICSAAAITCLSAVEDISAIGRDARDALWQTFLGNDGYLRPLAAILLSKLNLLKSTAAARIIPDDGEEATLFLFATRFKSSQALIDALAETISRASLGSYAVPSLLSHSIVVSSKKGLLKCKAMDCFKNPQTEHNICHYVAAKFIEDIIAGRIQGSILPNAIMAAIAGGLVVLAKQIYDLGRYSRIIGELPEIDQELASVEVDEVVPSKISTLPTIEGVTLDKLIISINSRIWLHSAIGNDGKSLYHEMVPDTELETIGQNLTVLMNVLEALREENILVIDKVEIRKTPHIEYALTITNRDEGYLTVAELISNNNLQEPAKQAEIVGKACVLLRKAEETIGKRNLPLDLIPVPTTHSLVTNANGDLRFRNVLSTIGSGKKYIGLNKCHIDLPRDKWETYTLGLLFFEVVTANCAPSFIQARIKEQRLADSADCKASGALFTGIIGKSTSKAPENRYENVEFFMKDVDEWSLLETALISAGLGSPLRDRLRHFWNIELGLERRAFELTRDHPSFLEIAPLLASYVIEELSKGGELDDDWLQPYFNDLLIKRPTEIMHLASLQALKVAEALENQLKKLKDAVKVEKNFTLPGWIRFAAATCEIESNRRTSCILAQGALHSLCEAFCRNVEIVIADGYKIKIGLPYNRNPSSAEMKLIRTLENNLKAISDRLLCWVKEPIPEPVWPMDLMVMGAFLLFSGEGLTIDKGQGNLRQIGPSNVFRLTEDFRKATLSFSKIYDFDHRRLYLASKEIETFHEVANLGALTGGMLSKLNLSKRLFGRLQEAAFQGLYTDQLSKMDLSPIFPHLNQRIIASKTSLLPFPKLSPFHGKGCPFSVEIIENKDDIKTVALSLPPIVRKTKEGLVCLTLRERVPLSKINQSLNILRSGLGYHSLYLLSIVGLFLFQVFYRDAGILPNNNWISALDGWIPNLGTAIPLYLYGKICVQKYRRLKSNTQIRDI
jgi:retron-type reverse transcriptase